MQVLHALDYLHADCGLIHTDLKPENVMLRRALRPRPADLAAPAAAQAAAPESAEAAHSAAAASAVAAAAAAVSPAQPSPAADVQVTGRPSVLPVECKHHHTHVKEPVARVRKSVAASAA